MKKLSLVLNVVLLIAVGVLYVLHFTGNNNVVSTSNNETSVEVGEIEYAIAYVNIDTLVASYKMFQDKRDEFNEKRMDSEAELESKFRELESQIRDFQDRYQKGLITRTKAQMMQEDLGRQEQQLYQLKDAKTYELAEEEAVNTRQVLYSITEYLKEFNQDKKFKYIVSSSFGGPFLYTDDGLDITHAVLEGINEKYESDKEKE